MVFDDAAAVPEGVSESLRALHVGAHPIPIACVKYVRNADPIVDIRRLSSVVTSYAQLRKCITITKFDS